MRKQFNAYLLRFTSPLHLANRRSDYSNSLTTLASDGLYAALTACLAKYGEQVPDNGDLGCVVSSLFPYYRKEEKDTPLFFFPKPMSFSVPNIEEDLKKFKKIQWIDSILFNNILNGKVLFDGNTEKLSKSMHGSFLTSSDAFTNFIKSQVSERVQIKARVPQWDKDDNPEPFYMDRILFTDNSGLYFIAEGSTELLEKALHYLSMEGIGTDRNVGNGFFEYEKQTIELAIPDSSDYIISLSSLIPKDDNELQQLLSGENVAYEIERRGGWVTDSEQPIRKNVVYLFTDGSVFFSNSKENNNIGKIVDLRHTESDISHPIWRFGKAICLPIIITNSYGR